MPGILAQILATKADLVDGKLKADQIPEDIGGGITLDDVKLDPDIASALSNDHAPGSDNQDLSGKVDKEVGKSLVPDTEITKLSGLHKTTYSPTPPSNPQPGEVWIVTSQ